MLLFPGTYRVFRLIKGFLFDVFGTVCDWHKPMTDVIESYTLAQGITEDASEFARKWRCAYASETARRASSREPFVPLATLTLEALKGLAELRLSTELTDSEAGKLNGVWRRLRPWPDTVAGLSALRLIAPCATCSNGSYVDMAPLAEHLGIAWDAVLGSETSGFYKPHPQTYLLSVEALAIKPSECVMVAAHQKDLVHARSHGLLTAFIKRPDEFGGVGLGEELEPTSDWDFVASSLLELAELVRKRV